MARMLDRGVTAIVAPNDRLAHAYYLWCKDAGIEIPRGLSLVGFDNLPESVGFPVASIDFGFARLGYLAAHILIGDIPVNENHEGVIAGIPTLIDSGSVERPAKQNPLVPR
jgi:DNA-binding LacI/PurR family transcriptional regulator